MKPSTFFRKSRPYMRPPDVSFNVGFSTTASGRSVHALEFRFGEAPSDMLHSITTRWVVVMLDNPYTLNLSNE